MAINKGGLVPRPYQRGLRPSLNADNGVYLEEELRRIEQCLHDISQVIPQTALKEPENPYEGMIRLAKAPWKPVGTEYALVTYLDGIWKPL